jgi:glycosyltransferase involved in cell wall biosynthesis
VSKKLCFVSLGAYGALTGKNIGYVGGAEVDQVLLARELARHEFDVSFVTFSEGGEDQGGTESVDGIKLFKVYSKDDSPKLNLISKSRFMWRAMQAADADIYFEEGVSGIAALFCYLKRRGFAYCIASDEYAIKRSMMGKRFIAELGTRLNARLATTIVAQNDFQAEAFRQNFGKTCVTIPPAYSFANQYYRKVQPPVVLWVANIKHLKQPELFLKLAEAIPEASFQMIGGLGSEEPASYYDKIKEDAARIPNLEFLGFVPFHEIDRYFQQASIFVNTSSYEGFPTTFVQAWAAGLPVVSLNVDPSGIISKNKIGFYSKAFPQMVSDIKQLLDNKELLSEMAQNARAYAAKNHDIKVVAERYLEVLDKVAI